MKYIVKALKEKNMKSEQIKHSLSVGIKSIQSRVFDRETDEVISFVKIPIKDSGLVRCEKGTREMNNEPVAWMIKTLDGRSLMLYGEEQPPKFKEDVQYIPLYTHPVKELTDEEIHRLADKHLQTKNHDGALIVLGLEDFAKALMEKMRNEQ